MTIEGALDEYVQALKSGTGGDIGVHGSIEVTRALLDSDLIDVVHLVVAPTLSAGGKTLWGTRDTVDRLALEHADTDSHGNLFPTYRCSPERGQA